MTQRLNILGIAGSLRAASYNRAALVAAQSLTPADAQLELCDLRALPLYNQDTEQEANAEVATFKKKIRSADAILFATPEYNYSIPGVLKNAIDIASRPYGMSAWAGKPVAIMGASISTLGTVRAQYHLRQCFVYLDMFPLNQPEVMIPDATRAFDAHGRLVDPTSEKLIAKLLQNLVEWTRRLSTK